MRTLEEVQKELDEVEAQIKAQQEGMPNYGDPGYRAARFDYIVDGDRSGLDAYQNALNAAIQNKLSRESAEKMAKEGKAQASVEEDDKIVQQLRDVDAVIDDLKKRNYSDDSVEMRKAKNEQDYWLKRAERKGLNVSLYRDTPKAPAASTAPAPAQANAAPTARTFENVASDIAQLGTDSTATMDRVAELRKEVEQHKSKVPYDKVDPLINTLNEKEKAIKDSNWKEYNSRVRAALGEKDYKKRKAALEPLKEELAKHDKNQEKYAEVEKSINDGLKKPTPDPLTRGVVRQNFGKNDVITMMKALKDAKEKGVTKNVSVGDKGRTVTFKLLQNGDVQVLNEKGKEIDRFKKADLVEFDTSNKIEVPPPQKVNPVASTLGGGTSFPNGRVIVGPGEDW